MAVRRKTSVGRRVLLQPRTARKGDREDQSSGSEHRGGAAGEMFRRQLAIIIERAGSQERLAQACRLSVQTVNDWKNGKSLPGFEQLLKLSQGSGVTLEWLCYGRGSESPTVSRSLESLEVDLARHVIEAVAREEGLTFTSVHEDLRIDARWLLKTVTARVLEQFRSTRKRFERDSTRELRNLQAIHYLEKLATLLGGRTDDPSLRSSALDTLGRLTEGLLSDIPEVEERLAGEPGVWFARPGIAYAALMPSAAATVEALAVKHEADPVLEGIRQLERSPREPRRKVVKR